MLFPWWFFVGGFFSNARTENVSDTWFLPEGNFPVFYRFFKEKMSWNEAKATCGLYQADILSVESSGQSDAARAYLRHLDVTDNIWINLKKDREQNFFLWANGENVLGDGYWAGPIPKSEGTLCVAIDPLSDFRWIPFFCEGPQVAPFVCELPVPDWVKKEDGCLGAPLPSLTVTFLPETGVVQLLSDCGSKGTRRLACKGGIERGKLIERLSCDFNLVNTVFSKSTTDATREQKSKKTEVTKTIRRALTRHKRHLDLSSPGFRKENARSRVLEKSVGERWISSNFSIRSFLFFSTHAFEAAKH